MTKQTIEINIEKDFGKYPGGRFPSHGKFSGQRFREDFLVKPLKEGKFIKIFLDGPVGYGSSFLEEAFGGLIRQHGFTKEFLIEHFILVTDDSFLEEEIKGYINS